MIIRDNFLLILQKTLCCDPSSDPSREDGLDEGSQHMLSMRNKKNIIKYSLLSVAGITELYPYTWKTNKTDVVARKLEFCKKKQQKKTVSVHRKLI